MTSPRASLRIGLVLAILLPALHYARAHATTFTQVTSDTLRETDPTPSPDGKWLAFTSDRCGKGSTQIYLMPIGGGEARALTDEPESTRATTPSWAPDSKSLLYVSTRGGRYNVYSVTIDGGKERKLTHAPGSHRFGTYSSDGKQIAFYSNRVRPGELYGFNIYRMGASGETETDWAKQVTNSMGSPGHPTWSPDGRWIAFVAKEFDSTRQQSFEGNILFTKYQLYKVRSEGGKERRLTKGTVEGQPFEDTWPSWSPDGKWIAFGRVYGSKRDVWILEVATNKTFPLTTAGNCVKPTWSYDSKSIYYVTMKDRNEDIWVATDLTLPVTPPPKKATSTKPGTKRPATKKSTASATKR